jgi:hypothetical protein
MRRISAWVASLIFAAAPLPALAAPQDAVLNKEGFWSIDVDNGACAASMTLQGGAIFLLRAAEGQVTFGYFSLGKPIRKGKAGRIETEAYGFDFKPSYGEDATTLFYDGNLEARALAALRLARQARILVDGQPVAAMTLEGTGFEGALDGVIACSKGESGWWGKGVGSASEPPVVYRSENDIWGIVNGDDYCFAHAEAPDERFIQLLAIGDGVALAIGARSGKLPKARALRVETDSYKLEVKAEYADDGTYVNSADPLEAADVFALKRAKRLRVTAGGRELVDVALASDSFPRIVEDVTACARGEKGWWGEGAKPPAS